MIHINLLPEEYRRRARTPIKMTLAVAGVIAANALLLVWFAWLALGVMAEIDSERDVLQTELDGLTPQVEFHKSLEAERKSFAAREETLANITGSRINWTRKVDELVTVINSGGGGERHYVWLDDLNVVQNVDARSKGAGSVRASGHSGSDKFDQIANFLEDVERSPFIEEFLPPAPPAGTQSNEDKELLPAVVWSFPLQLEIKSLEQRQQERAKASEQKGKAAPAKDQPGPEAKPAAEAGDDPAGATPAQPTAAPAQGEQPAATTKDKQGAAQPAAAKASEEGVR
jgi:Tfp pilus assembly protein PilN